jgi:hypothetical protein
VRAADDRVRDEEEEGASKESDDGSAHGVAGTIPQKIRPGTGTTHTRGQSLVVAKALQTER